MHVFELLEKARKWISHNYYRSRIQGKNASLSLKGNVNIVSPKMMTVGENCCINDGVQIHAGGGITLGDNVTISMGAKLITRSYDTKDWFGQCQKIEQEMSHVERAIFLNDHTWVGAGAIILPGVCVSGKGVIVSAGTVLSKNIEEDYVLVAGSPARIVKKYPQGK